MSKGKGGGGAPQGTNNNDVMIAERAQAERDAARQREDAQRSQMLTDRLATFRANSDAAIPKASTRYMESLAGRGVTGEDAYTVAGRALGEGWRSVPQDTSSIDGFDVNVDNYFTDALLQDAYGDVRDERRQNYGTQVANRFRTGAENTLIRDTADDPFVDAFLGSQRQDAASMLERARARGNLDDAGFTRGQQRLDELGTAGRSEAQKITDALIESGRGNLRSVANRATADASAYELGRSFSLDPYETEWNSKLSSFNTGLEGSVRSALEGQQFFDIGDIITQAGIRQGAQNPTQGQADAVAARQRIRDADRGVGGGGQF